MGDRYIPTPHDGQYLPGDIIDGRREAEERGNRHPFNSPAWHVWNDGYQAAVRKFVSRMVELSDKPRNGVPSKGKLP